MKYERLKESIHALYDMELHNSIMEQCIHQIDQKMATLMIYRDIPVPGKKWIHDTDIEVKKRRVDAIIGFAAGILLGGMIGAMCGIFFFSDFIMQVIIICFGAFLSAILCGWAGGRADKKIENMTRKKIYEKWEKDEEIRYQEEQKRYEKDKAADEKRVKNEKRIWDHLNQQREFLSIKKEESLVRLAKFYDLVEILPEYRGLNTIGYMNQLIQLGISKQTEGVGGLYYWVRMELRQQEYTEKVMLPGKRMYTEWKQACQFAKKMFQEIYEEAVTRQKQTIAKDYAEKRKCIEAEYEMLFQQKSSSVH
ncbi:MAG: hypothetical protein ACLU6B_08265 [Lachnospirales bacterium]